jgi:hypothetical protein
MKSTNNTKFFNQKLFIFFLLLTLTNIAIFIFRDRFTYHPNATYSSLYSQCDQTCINKWKQFISDYPQQDLIEGKKMLDTVIKKKNISTSEKILSIAGFLYDHFNKQVGIPSSVLFTSPLEQFKLLNSNNSLKLWCGNFAFMFTYFCWSEGITSRVVEIKNPGDHHVINECYLPETGKWVMIDVTSNQLLTKNKDGQFLNFLKYKEALKKNFPLFKLAISKDSVEEKKIDTSDINLKQYFKTDHPVYYYYRVNDKKIYTTVSKIKRYFLPDSWYELYDNNEHSNILFYAKLLFFILWFIALLLAIFKFIIH